MKIAHVLPAFANRTSEVLEDFGGLF